MTGGAVSGYCGKRKVSGVGTGPVRGKRSSGGIAVTGSALTGDRGYSCRKPGMAALA